MAAVVAARPATALAAVALSIGACATAPVARSRPDAATVICDRAGGRWEASTQKCTATVTKSAGDITITATYPAQLVSTDGPGQVLTTFLDKFFAGYRNAPDHAHGTVELTYQMFQGSSTGTESVDFGEYSFLGGAHPNMAVHTFTFDRDRRTQIQLTELLCGRDPDATLPPLVRPYLQRVLDQHNARMPGTPPLQAPEFEPAPPGSTQLTYVESYDAWVIDGDMLVLLLPSARQGPVGAALLTTEVPLNVVRDPACAA